MGILMTKLILGCVPYFCATLASVYVTLSSLYHHFQSGYKAPDGVHVPAGTTTGLDQQRLTHGGEHQCLMAKGRQA